MANGSFSIFHFPFSICYASPLFIGWDAGVDGRSTGTTAGAATDT